MHRAGVLVALGAFLVCNSAAEIAQERPMRADAVIRSETKLVQVVVTVWDERGKLANDLSREDFVVFVDGVEQKISYFSHERVPVSFVLSTDASTSVEHKIPFFRQAALDLLEPFPDEKEQYRYGDEFALVRFGSKVELVESFMTGRELRNRIGGGSADPFVRPAYDKGSTSLFDAVYASADVAKRRSMNKRRAVILLTDGGDNHSFYSFKKTKSYLAEMDTPFFAIVSPPVYLFQDLFAPTRKQKDATSTTIGLPSAGGSPVHVYVKTEADLIGPAERRGPRNLKELAGTSGGAVFQADDETDIPRIVRALGAAIRYSYLIEFAPRGLGRIKRRKDWDGRHTLKVQLMPAEQFRGYAVYYKRGYNDPDP